MLCCTYWSSSFGAPLVKGRRYTKGMRIPAGRDPWRPSERLPPTQCNFEDKDLVQGGKKPHIFSVTNRKESKMPNKECGDRKFWSRDLLLEVSNLGQLSLPGKVR